MQDYKKLDVWMKSHLLAKEIYVLTGLFPKDELYGIVSQLRRAAVSIPTNIAEGAGKASKADFGRYLQISFGSANEVEYLAFLSSELNYIDKESFDKLNPKIEEVKKMIAGLIKTVNR